MTPVFDGYANSNENAKGVAYPAINDDRLYRAVIALPPLAEQKRIVAKIEELLPYIDRYEQAWSKLEQFNSRFPEDMKKSLLQYAIQGKLVEQRPEEGTAEELFAQIQEEKQRLIQEGKIKKEKPLPEITDDEKPFEIPESWMWVRLRNIVYNRGQLTPQCTFSYIDIGSIDNQRQLLNTGENIVEADKAPSRVPFPVSWTVKMKKKQKETQDILSYHTQAAGCSDKARAKASGGRQPIEECGRTGL